MFPFFSKSVHLTVIGDTHRRHEELGHMKGEVLIHVGDMCDLFDGDQAEIEKIDAWFARQEFDLILCIAGNHDFPIERRPKNKPVFSNATYLEDESFSYRGLTFYGTPWVPDLASHAFYANDQELPRKWDKIPDETDVLITHTPPAGVMDQSSNGMRLGCEHLAARLTEIQPKAHLFGHVHASGGVDTTNGCVSVNAASLVKMGLPLRDPVQIRVPAKK